MSVFFTTAEVAQFQADAQSRMLDEFDIKVSSGFEYDPELGEDRETFDLLFHTVGRVKAPGGLAVRDADAGGRTVVSVVRELHIPVDSPDVPTGAIAFPTSVHATSDPMLEGARLRIAGPSPGSQTTARRLQVEEVLT